MNQTTQLTGQSTTDSAWPSADDLHRVGDRQKLLPYLRDVWQRRDFVIELARSDLRTQNTNTALGNAWHLLNPLILAGVYLTIFGLILGISRGQDNYVGFLVIGVFIFHYSGKSLRAGARSLTANSDLLRSISFPRGVLPLSKVAAETLMFGPALLTMLAIVTITGEKPTGWWLLLLPVWVVQALFNLGLAMALARLSDHFRDVQQVLPYALRIWLYTSGVFYAVGDFVEDTSLLLLFELNPMYAFIELVRGALMKGGTDPRLWAVAGGWAALSLVGGFVFFRRREHEYGHV